MTTHRLDTDISNRSDDEILKRLMDSPARIPMLDMICVVGLRERGFVICGQEMANCIAIHAHDGDRIIEGVPTTFAWVVITPKGRAHLHSQGYMVPDEFGTVKVPRYRELPGIDGKPSQFMAITAREQATIEDRVGASMEEIMMQPDPQKFVEARLHDAVLPGALAFDGDVLWPTIVPIEYEVPSPSLMQTLSDMERAQILATGINGEDLDD